MNFEIRELKNKGYFSEAILNFVGLLGWAD
jgi:hypothetical protein